MSKITLNNFNTLQNSSIISTLNTNNALIENAVENTLSKDGTSPNQMSSDLDMNSFNILNLPTPNTLNSPVRLVDIVPGTSVNLPDYNGIVLYAVDFPGSTAGDKILNCVNALPSSGGVCDARGLASGGTIPAMTLSKSGVTILWPYGFFLVTGTIQVYNASTGIQGVIWRGGGGSYTLNGGGTTFLWFGNASDPLIRLRGVRDSVFTDFGINSSTFKPLAEGIRLETQTGVGATSRVFRDIRINGTLAGITKGFRWCIGDDAGGSGGDANNDLDWIENTVVTNYSNAAFSIEHGQSKTHTFMNSSFVGNSLGQRGVTTTQAANPARNSGSFRWYGGGGGGNLTADFDIGSPDDNINITSANLESSNRFIQTAGPSTSPYATTVTNCRWAMNELNADNNVILFQYKGPLNLIGNFFEGAPVGFSPKFNINTSSPARGVAIGNSISWDVATVDSNPFIGTADYWEVLGNIIIDNSNNAFPIIDRFASNPLTVATLPPSPTKGAKVFVTDANTTFTAGIGAVVVGGGSNNVPVFYDGTNWRIG